MAWRRISPLLALTAAAAIVLVAALLLLPLAISPQRVQSHLVLAVHQLLGADLKLSQPPTLSYFPVFRATLNDVALTTPEQGDSRPAISAETIEIDLSLLSALSGQINVTSMRLVRPHFVVEDHGGSLSTILQQTLARPYSLVASMMAQTRVVIDANPSNPDASKLPSVRFGKVMIEDGLMVLHRGGGEADEQISSITGSLTWPQSDAAIGMKARAIWHGEAVDVEASSSRPLFLLAGGTAPIKLAVASTPLNLSLDGDANLSNNLFVSGKLSLKSPSLRRILEWSRTKIDPGAAIGSVAIDANMTLGQGRVKLDNVALTLDNNPGKGVLEIGTENGLPKVTGTLAFGSLDLRSFLSAFTPLPDSSKTAAEGIDTKFLNQVGLDVRFSANTATAGPFTLMKMAATAQVKSGQASFDIGDSTALGGTLQASFQLNRTDSGNVGELRLNGTDIDSSELASALGIQQQFPLAKASVSAILKGPITDWASVPERATGTVQMHFGKGQIKGFNLPQFVKRARTNGFFSIDDMTGSTFAFDTIDIKASVADGVASLDAASVHAQKTQITLTGIVPFVGRSLALSGHMTMPPPATSAAEKATDPNDIYFFVGGSWDRPFISPVLFGPQLGDHL